MSLFVAIQTQPKFRDVGVQCNIERSNQKESTPDILEQEYVATEEDSGCKYDTDSDTDMFHTEATSSQPDTPE